MLGKTRLEMEEKLKEAAAWVTAAIVGIGVAVSLTIIFVSAGMKIILAGAAIGLCGLGMSRIVPLFYKFHTITCPKCLTVHQVLAQAEKFECDGCGRTLYGQGFWRHGANHKHQKVLLSGNKFTPITAKTRNSEQESKIQ